jgi:anti-anti-sigma regulatory factor
LPITVFHVKDNLNMGNYQELENKAQEAYNSGVRYLVLDLADSRFLSSAGITGLIKIYKLFNKDAPEKSNEKTEKPGKFDSQTNKHLRLCNCSPSIVNVLTIAGLRDMLGVFESLQDAVNSFDSG